MYLFISKKKLLSMHYEVQLVNKFNSHLSDVFMIFYTMSFCTSCDFWDNEKLKHAFNLKIRQLNS